MTDLARMLDALEFARSFFEARAQMATPGSEGAGKLYECAKGCADAIALLKAQEPVVHGRWIDDVCSECGQYVYHGDANNYCPNCGAKMRDDE